MDSACCGCPATSPSNSPATTRSPAQIAEVAHRYGLDQPLYIQYVEWARNALSGDLGRSLFTNESVSELIAQRIGVTVQLAFMSIILADRASRFRWAFWPR